MNSHVRRPTHSLPGPWFFALRRRFASNALKYSALSAASCGITLRARPSAL